MENLRIAQNEWPIYKDLTITENIGELEYHIDLDGTTIYAGKAYKYPNADNVQFTINDACGGYLHSTYPESYGLEKDSNYMRNFVVNTSIGTQYSYNIYNDWSYKLKNETSIINNPISNLVGYGQTIYCSILVFETATLYVYINDELYEDVTLEGPGLYNYTIPAHYQCGSKIRFEVNNSTLEYEVDRTKKYVLYYSNAAGGWDSLLIGGNVRKVDEIQSEIYMKKNPDPLEFDKTKYLNTIKPQWSLYTGYLSDENSLKMFNLLESLQVYLYDLETKELVPVVITDNVCEYKTYTNNGKKKSNYIIKVEGSKNKYRQ